MRQQLITALLRDHPARQHLLDPRLGTLPDNPSGSPLPVGGSDRRRAVPRLILRRLDNPSTETDQQANRATSDPIGLRRPGRPGDIQLLVRLPYALTGGTAGEPDPLLLADTVAQHTADGHAYLQHLVVLFEPPHSTLARAPQLVRQLAASHVDVLTFLTLNPQPTASGQETTDD